MSPIDQGKYASYLYYHGLLDKHQYDQLDIIDKRILKMIEGEKWLDAWKSSDDQLNFILTSLNYGFPTETLQKSVRSDLGGIVRNP